MIKVGHNPKVPMSYDALRNKHAIEHSDEAINKRVKAKVKANNGKGINISTMKDNLNIVVEALKLLNNRTEQEFMRKFLTLCQVTTRQNAYIEMARLLHNSIEPKFINAIQAFERKIQDKLRNLISKKNGIEIINTMPRILH